MRLPVLALVLLSLAACRPAPPRAVAPVPLGPRGLETVPIDSWLPAFFAADRVDGPPLARAARGIVAAYEKAPAEGDWLPAYYASLEPYARRYATAEEIFRLVEAIYEARRAIARRALRPGQRLERARAALFLLGILADESLYAASRRFPLEGRIWKVSRAAGPPPCRVGPANEYEGTGLCAGDLLITKSSTFAALLFTFRAPHSGTYSHVYLPVRDRSGDRTFLLESEVMGGALVPIASVRPPKGSVYRLVRGAPTVGDAHRKAGNGVLELLERSRPFARPELGKLFDFNYAIKPDCKTGSYFCAELAYCAHRLSGLPEELSPFPSRFWTDISDDGDDFVTYVLDFHWARTPVPSDIELNPAYEPILHWTRLDGLPELRIRWIVMSELVSLLRRDRGLRDDYLEAFKPLGRLRLRDLTEGRAGLLARIVSEKNLKLAQERVDPEMRLQEVLFFYHFHSVLLPGLKKHAEQELPAPEGGFVPLDAIRRTVRARLEPSIRELIREMKLLNAFR